MPRQRIISYRKSVEQQNHLVFLSIMKDFYPSIIQATSKITVWNQVLKECKKNGFFGDKSARYLSRTRWPAFLRNTHIKWLGKKMLSERDLIVIGIERMKRPDFCFPMNENDKLNEDGVVPEGQEHVEENDYDMDAMDTTSYVEDEANSVEDEAAAVGDGSTPADIDAAGKNSDSSPDLEMDTSSDVKDEATTDDAEDGSTAATATNEANNVEDEATISATTTEDGSTVVAATDAAGENSVSAPDLEETFHDASPYNTNDVDVSSSPENDPPSLNNSQSATSISSTLNADLPLPLQMLLFSSNAEALCNAANNGDVDSMSSLYKDYLTSTIRAMNSYSELAQLKIDMIRQKLSNSHQNNAAL